MVVTRARTHVDDFNDAEQVCDASVRPRQGDAARPRQVVGDASLKLDIAAGCDDLLVASAVASVTSRVPSVTSRVPIDMGEAEEVTLLHAGKRPLPFLLLLCRW